MTKHVTTFKVKTQDIFYFLRIEHKFKLIKANIQI